MTKREVMKKADELFPKLTKPQRRFIVGDLQVTHQPLARVANRLRVMGIGGTAWSGGHRYLVLSPLGAELRRRLLSEGTVA